MTTMPQRDEAMTLNQRMPSLHKARPLMHKTGSLLHTASSATEENPLSAIPESVGWLV